jgi:hypothetical protein
MEDITSSRKTRRVGGTTPHGSLSDAKKLQSSRSEDNNGIDAQVTGWWPFTPGGSDDDLKEVDLKIQLKATINSPADSGTHYSYFFDGIPQYNDLRVHTVGTHRILVVLFLPREDFKWLIHDVESLSQRGAQ